MKTLTIDGVPFEPTHTAYRPAGFPTVDAFRAHMKRYPHAPKPVKIGQANFYKRADLEAIKAARKAK